MLSWKKWAVFKAWKHVKQYDQIEEEKLKQAKDLLEKRKKMRVMTYFKLAIVESRKRYLNKQLLVIHLNQRGLAKLFTAF